MRGQGHVVAEQQLPIPASWLKLPPSEAKAAASGTTAGPDGGLKLAHKAHGGVKHISISGADGLHVEVCQSSADVCSPDLSASARALTQLS